MNKKDPVEVAGNILREKYPQALFAFAGGSFNHGEATAYSDIDLVVVFETLPHGWRESFTFEDWPVEAFVHDPQTLRYFFQRDVESGACILPTMVSEGPVVPNDHSLATEFKNQALEIIRTGPAAWDEQTIEEKRYQITNLVDDLRAPRSHIEAAATIGAIHEKLAEFYLRTNGRWWAGDKHIPRKLTKADPALAARWSEIFLKALAGERQLLLALTEEMLAPHGGLLFDGYKLPAPADWRLA